MNAKFICHKDFSAITPIDVFHKEQKKLKIEPSAPYLNRHILFRRKAVLAKTEKAILRITADDYYKLYINGKFVTQGPSPCYPHSYNYNEINITDFLREGENTFAVHTYYQGLINRVWVSGDRRQMLYFSLTSNGEEVLVSNTDWRCANHTGYTEHGRIGYDTAFAECYNSASPEESFFSEDYNDSAWEYAAIYQAADYILKKQTTSQLCLYDIKPQAMTQYSNRIQIDFGREMVGYLYAEADGKIGDEILLRYGEELDENGHVRYELRCNCRYEEKWILSGKHDILRQFDYKAFRYAELIFPEGTELSNIRMTVRHYPFENRAVYKTSNTQLKQILSLCEDTIHYGTQEVFVDCPTREKGQYLGDVSISGRAHAVLTGKTDMIKKAITDFFDSSFICPGIMAVSTSSLMQEIADYSLQLPAQVCWVYSIDKDIEFLKYAEPYLTGLYQYFLQYENSEGLIEGVTEKWNLVDWPDNLRDGYNFPLTKPIGDGAHNVLNAFWCGFLQAMDEFYSLLGKEETHRTQKAKEAFIQNFYSEETGLFCDSPEKSHSAIHSNILPLLFDIGTENSERYRRMINLLAQKRLNSMGVYMAYFALAALKKHGEDPLAEKLATDEGCWLNMLREGATATFEAWGKDQKWNTSLFHPWASAPAIIFAEGVRPY